MSSYSSNHSTTFAQPPYQYQHQHHSHRQQQPQPPYPTTPNASHPNPLPMPSAPRDPHPSTSTTTHPVTIPTRQPLAQGPPPTSTQPLPDTAPQMGYTQNHNAYTTHHTSHANGDYAYPDANGKRLDDGVDVKDRSTVDKTRHTHAHTRRDRERERSAQRRPTMGDSVVSLASKVKHGLGF